jgi:hypothetical protein
VSWLLALETGDMTQILLWGSWAVLIAITSITIHMADVIGTVVAISSMVMSSMSMTSMGVVSVSS